MLLRSLRGTGPGVLLLIIVIFATVWAGAFIIPEPTTQLSYDTAYMPLYGFLKTALGSQKLSGPIFSAVLGAIMTLLLVKFNATCGFISSRTFLPALVYILITGLFPDFQILNPVLPASLFLLLAIMSILEGYEHQGIVYNFFDAAFLISTGSLFYANLIWFGILVFIGIAVLRTGKPVEFLVTIIGLIAPYFLVFGIYYVIGKDIKELLRLIFVNLFEKEAGYQYPILILATLAIVTLGILASLSNLFRLINTKKIKSRKVFVLLLSAFLISIGVFVAVPSASAEMIWLISIPSSYFLSFYFVFTKKKVFPEIYFWTILLLVLIIQFVNLRLIIF